MPCLQIYRELSSLATFLGVRSNSNEASYLSWQNMYPNLKTTCHIKLKFFLWAKFFLWKILESLFLEKCFISVAAALITEECSKPCQIYKMMKHIENPDTVKAVFSGILRDIQRHVALFSHVQACLGTLRYAQAYSGITEA